MKFIFGRSSSSTAKYVPLKSLDGATPAGSRSVIILMGVLILALSLVSRLSFIAGRHSSTQCAGNVLNLTSHTTVFWYNRLFAERPNATTDSAWRNLFPIQGGFFRHPHLAPQRSTFAVFHQLHCLDAIRHGYWMLFDLASEGKKMNESELPFHASSPHIRHCIDLLRNVFVCQPDLTVEVKDDELGGVTGFGTEHQCVDWAELVDWTTQWESYQQTPGAKKKEEIT